MTTMHRRRGPTWTPRRDQAPVLQILIREAGRQRVSRKSLAAISGVPLTTMAHWTDNPGSARLEQVEACFNALGFTLRVATPSAPGLVPCP